MRPENRIIKGATRVIKIIAASDLSAALHVSVVVKHAQRVFSFKPDFIIEGNTLTFIWNPSDQPFLGVYEISCRAEYGQNSIGYCDWAGFEGIELVDHSFQERVRNSQIMEVSSAIELHGEVLPVQNGLSAYDIWRSQGHAAGTVAEFLEDIKGPKGDKGDTGGFLFPEFSFDATTGELVISGPGADRFSYDEETGELVISV